MDNRHLPVSSLLDAFPSSILPDSDTHDDDTHSWDGFGFSADGFAFSLPPLFSSVLASYSSPTCTHTHPLCLPLPHTTTTTTFTSHHHHTAHSCPSQPACVSATHHTPAYHTLFAPFPTTYHLPPDVRVDEQTSWARCLPWWWLVWAKWAFCWGSGVGVSLCRHGILRRVVVGRLLIQQALRVAVLSVCIFLFGPLMVSNLSSLLTASAYLPSYLLLLLRCLCTWCCAVDSWSHCHLLWLGDTP